MHVQLPSQVQPYLYVYIDLILRYYMFRLDAIFKYECNRMLKYNIMEVKYLEITL
jgi:hypothetical protein